MGLHIKVFSRPAKAQVRVVHRPERIEIPIATIKRKKSVKHRMREKQEADKLQTTVQESVELYWTCCGV